MIRRLAGRLLSIVAAVASADHFRVVHAAGRGPGIGAVARITVVGTGNMVRWFSLRRLPVVASVTIAGDFIMVHSRDRRPGGGAVTCIAVVGCIDMIRGLAGGRLSIVTTVATAYHFRVVHLLHRRPGAGVVTGLAIAAGIDVLRRFSICHRAIVTTHAVANDLVMINPLQGQPARCTMAVITLGTGGRMVCRLAFHLHPVMAYCAWLGGEEVIKPRNAETPEVVALTAFQVGRDVRRLLAAGEDAVMTLAAIGWRAPVGLVPVTVAIAAVDVTVRSLQGETEGVVIELGRPDSAKWYLEAPGIVAGAAFLLGDDMLGRARG